MQHLIRKQTILLTVPKELDAFSMQHLAGRHFRKEVLPLLEQLFNELSGSEELIQIQKLEIDLGQITEKDMRLPDWNDPILATIKKQLYSKLGKESKEKIFASEHTILSVVKQWMYYMQHGCLPWNAMHTDENWYKQVLEALAVDFEMVGDLKKLIQQNALARRRIILQHDESFLIMLIEILTAENQRTLPRAITEIGMLYLMVWPQSETSANLVNIWQQLLLAAAAESNPGTGRLLEKVLADSLPGAGNIQQALTYLSPDLGIVSPIVKILAANQELFLKKKNVAADDTSAKQNDNTTEADDVINEEGIFVQYAGIVLIHPFISQLFKKMQLVKEGKFENAGLQQKALYLLHYLATGKTTAAEFELAVPKLLCNWPMENPVGKNGLFNQDELEEADNMLQAAIDQWTVLKSTSVDGLREGFLQRPGKLSRKKDKLYLQVEAGPIDLLLDQLPWNLGMIKLPWMKELLWVEWR